MRPAFMDGVRLGLAQGNVVGGVLVDAAAMVVGSAWMAVLGGICLTFGLAAWGSLGWRWRP